MSDSVAGEKAGLQWAVQLSVIALVVLWLIPTVGLFVSSFRERDQISATGWWKAPFSVDLAFRGRAAGDGARQEGDVWVIEGNIFEDREVQAAFGEGGTGRITAFGTRGVAPGEFPAGETADLGDGESLTLNEDGSYRFVSPEEIDGAGPRIYFEASTPPRFTLDNYRTVLASTAWTGPSSTRSR
jgi:alpha-glucoside transport system permease protein